MIHPDADLAEYIAARDRRELKQHPRRPLPQTYYGERLVNIGGVALVPESMAAELLSEVAS
jgi:delta 1-pyrroline-5-carboxylate dehydrogenase